MKLIARGGVLCRESKGGQAGVPRRGGIISRSPAATAREFDFFP